MVVVGEGLADRHFRRLAALLPEQRDELLRLGAMEGRHAVDFAGCGRNLGVKADSGLAHRLLAPLHQQFQEAEAQGDLVSCLVIQCLIIECFAVAAYRLYLPVADAYARPSPPPYCAMRPNISTSANSGCGPASPRWRSGWRPAPADLRAIGIEPLELVAEFVVEFQAALEAIGYGARDARRLLNRLTARALS
jgi:fatty aldehyde decarbonylase